MYPAIAYHIPADQEILDMAKSKRRTVHFASYHSNALKSTRQSNRKIFELPFHSTIEYFLRAENIRLPWKKSLHGDDHPDYALYKKKDKYKEILSRLLQVRGIGTVFVNKLVCDFKKFGEGNFEDFVRFKLTEKQMEEFANNKIQIASNNAEMLSIFDDEYPESLFQFLSSNTPPLLYYIGNIQLLKTKRVAISGSRKVSSKGLEITQQCVEELINHNITTVSGNANGVDKQAQLTTLSYSGNSIIVLPEGISFFKIPKEFESIWDWNRVLVISEFSPNDKWSVGRAMQRNGTIIGLSEALIVVEAAATGGSIDAGRKALRSRNPLFVPQYSECQENTQGNALLIQEGAYPLRRSAATMRPNLSKLLEVV